MSESVTKEKTKGQPGRVTYSVSRMRNCSHPECDSRRNYGVKVTKVEQKYLMDFIPFGESQQSKVFCPKHRDSVPESRKALEKEHEKAREKWQNKKRKQRRKAFNKITDSDILPSFKYRRGSLAVNDSRFRASGFDSFEEAVDYVSSFEFEVPLLVYKRDRISIIHPSEQQTEKFDVDEEMLGYEEFKQRFSEVKYPDRILLPVRTNSLTAMDSKSPVCEIEDHVDEVVAWKEYDESQGHMTPKKCRICDSDWGTMDYSRARVNGEEVIIVSHSRCEKIIGELNRKMIDQEAYEIGFN
mgnify:FL=1